MLQYKIITIRKIRKVIIETLRTWNIKITEVSLILQKRIHLLHNQYLVFRAFSSLIWMSDFVYC